jgi:hypothetical protein
MFHHRVVNLWKICIINRVWNMFLFQAIWSCLELSWISGSVHCWKMGLQGPTLRAAVRALSKRICFSWLFILCGSQKQAHPCSIAEMCWAKSLPWTACDHITKQCPSLSLKSRLARLVHQVRTGSLGEVCPPGLELGASNMKMYMIAF